ncbi:DUF805 domain-containing protein [Brevundimonas staleyi]|uniref:DUF805 domain-containing protein n=1 Tax=Brevundimonas staleyi TaxID=74326 RepID=A0ABW0FXS9_9CAUL
MTSLPRLFSFEGRARRFEWWLTCIAVSLLAGLIVAVAALAISGGDASILGRDAPKPAAVLVLNLIAGAVVIWIQAAVGVRRVHDRGQSGAGLILYQVIGYAMNAAPVVLHLTGGASPYIPFGGFMMGGLMVVYVLWSLYFLITLGFLEGEPTANAYGRSPKTVQTSTYAAPALD